MGQHQSRKYDIVEQVARERRVEGIIRNVCNAGPEFRPELGDFAQMIYLALLEKDDALIERLWDAGKLDYYIVAMVQRQWYTGHSAFRDLFTKYQRKCGDLGAEGFDCNRDDIFADDYFDKPRIERGG